MDGKLKTRVPGVIPQSLGRPVGVLPISQQSRRRITSNDTKIKAQPPGVTALHGRVKGERPNSGSRKKIHTSDAAVGPGEMSLRSEEPTNCHLESRANKQTIEPVRPDQLSSKKSITCQGRGKHIDNSSARNKSRRGSGKTERNNFLHTNTSESDIKFFDIPNSPRTGACGSTDNDGRDSRLITPISAEDILLQSQEKDFTRVYEICLHASNVGAIEHIEKFKKVRVLDLSCNFIEKIENLETNQDIRDLKLYDNRISLIEKLDNLKELCSLQLQHNKIKKIGRGLRNLKKLRCLRLDSNQVLSIEPREISCCPHITSLDVSYNMLDNLAALNYLPNLEDLAAAGNRLRTISNMNQCKRLRDVDLSRNRITDLSGLRGLPNLQVLNISNNQLKTLKSIGKSMSLMEILAADNKIIELAPFGHQFPHLEILHITDNMVSEWEEVCRLENLSDLVELFISGNPFMNKGQELVPYHTEIQHVLPNLEILDGAHVKRNTNKGAPLMRPMSASSVLSVRQMETQINAVTTDLMAFEKKFLERFDSLKMSFQELPAEAPISARKPKSANDLTFTAEPPNTSRCSSRARIRDAQAFAAQHS